MCSNLSSCKDSPRIKIRLQRDSSPCHSIANAALPLNYIFMNLWHSWKRLRTMMWYMTKKGRRMDRGFTLFENAKERSIIQNKIRLWGKKVEWVQLTQKEIFNSLSSLHVKWIQNSFLTRDFHISNWETTLGCFKTEKKNTTQKFRSLVTLWY